MNQRSKLGHAAVRTHDICRTAPMPPRAPRAVQMTCRSSLRVPY